MEMEMEAESLWSNPRSFKMDRKCPQASKLKSAVSQKLFEFLGNYSDDVLAEYIVVLVCNGKHQNQARDDLEAFLGDASGEFVMWLWEHLSKNIFLSNTPPGSSNLKDDCFPSGCDDKVDEQRVSRSGDIQNHAIGISDNSLSKEGMKGQTSKFAPREISPNAVEASEDFQRWYPAFNALLTEENTEGVPAQICKKEISENSPETDDSRYEAMKHGPSRVRFFPGISAGVEQSLQFQDQCKKILNKKCCVSQPQFLHSRKREPALRNLQSAITENLHSRPSTTNATGTRLSSKAVNSLSHQNPRQRGNVWDRLGKPCAGNCDVMDEKNYMLGIDIVKRMKMENGGEGLDNDRLTWVVPGGGASIKSMEEIDELDNGYRKVITSTHADDPRGREHGINQTGMHHDAGDSRRKRQFGEVCPGNGSVSLSHGRDEHLQNEAAFQELQRLTSVKFSRSQSLDGVTTETRSSDGLFSGAMPHSHRSPNTVLNPGAYKVSQPQLNREVLVTTTTQNLPSLNSSLLAKSNLSIMQKANVAIIGL